MQGIDGRQKEKGVCLQIKCIYSKMFDRFAGIMKLSYLEKEEAFYAADRLWVFVVKRI